MMQETGAKRSECTDLLDTLLRGWSSSQKPHIFQDKDQEFNAVNRELSLLRDRHT